MVEKLSQLLHHRNPFVRKGAMFLLQIPKRAVGRSVEPQQLGASPPVFANSFPKSGTHLLDQIVEALPERRNYGAFLSSMTSSFRFTERSTAETLCYIRASVPGEIVRAHLFFDPDSAAALDQCRVVHYFIYRDPRDVCLSEANYLRTMNRWHKMSGRFREAESIEAAITLAIEGLVEPVPGLDYPNIAERFRKYQGWLTAPNVYAVKFEELTSKHREARLREMMEFYLARSENQHDGEKILERMQAGMVPERSHTFRQGKRGGWRERFTPQHCELFKELAGETLVELGYESDLDW